MVWKPHVTVAAVIENKNKFLLVEEQINNGIAFNQPAGHLEEGENMITAVKREVNEETAWKFEAESIIAIQLWRKTPDSPSFLRVCFSGFVHSFNADQALDDDIITTHWLTREQVANKNEQLRSPLVLKSIDQYLTGLRHPLSLLKSYIDYTDE
ncbi:MAG: NUDIX hydrolase [Methylococcales bacterium]|nr:NUDIX hydrolase [Methylococcales bacterium]